MYFSKYTQNSSSILSRQAKYQDCAYYKWNDCFKRKTEIQIVFPYRDLVVGFCSPLFFWGRLLYFQGIASVFWILRMQIFFWPIKISFPLSCCESQLERGLKKRVYSIVILAYCFSSFSFHSKRIWWQKNIPSLIFAQMKKGLLETLANPTPTWKSRARVFFLLIEILFYWLR